MHLKVDSICSRVLKNERRVWIQPSAADRPAQAVCVLLDGEYYVERMGAPPLLAELQESQVLPPLAFAYVSHIDGGVRWTESFCNDQFADFIREELLPWTASQFDLQGRQVPTILGGLSLTGLAAAHAAITCSGRISGVLCQSASFWWEDNRIVSEYRRQKVLPFRFRISCGNRETTEYVEHAANLIQKTAQLTCNRMMRDVLLENGWDVSYEEFDGGHDLNSWKNDLPHALRAFTPASK